MAKTCTAAFGLALLVAGLSPVLSSCGELAHADDDGSLYAALIGQPVGLQLATGETVAGTLLGVDAALFLVQLPSGATKKVVRALVTDVKVGAAAGVPAAGSAAVGAAPMPVRAEMARQGGGSGMQVRHGLEVGNPIGYKLSLQFDKGALDAVAFRAGAHLLTLLSWSSPAVGLGPLGVQVELGRNELQFITGFEFNAPYAYFSYFAYPMVLTGFQVDPQGPFEFELGLATDVVSFYLARPHLSFGWVW